MYGERVNLIKGQVPEFYHCRCKYCQKILGELLRPDGSYYSRLERRQYYDPSESGSKNADGSKKHSHIAKSPLHVSRWAIQQYTKPDQWVLDPTCGAGTTIVEAVTQGRNAAGMELEYGDILKANIAKAKEINNLPIVKIGNGDAREIATFLEKAKVPPVHLVLNNPPYSGDVSMPSPKGKLRGKEHRDQEITFKYDKTLPNLAFLKEGEEYWQTMMEIYKACVGHLVKGGFLVLGIKDMSKNKEPFLLHKMFCEQIEDSLKLKFVGTAFLKHHPGTLHLNSCMKRHGFEPPKHQTISVFKK
jgi:DNA modification methylase